MLPYFTLSTIANIEVKFSSYPSVYFSLFFRDRSGVYSEPNCNPEGIDKGVLAVGYGTQQGVDYWIVRNKYVFTKILKYGFDIDRTYLGHVATKPIF